MGLGRVVLVSSRNGLPSSTRRSISAGAAGDRDIERKIELEVESKQILELDREKVTVPSGDLSQAVVGDPQRPLLGVVEMLDAHHRHGGKLEQPRRRDPPMAGNELASGVGDDRAENAKGADRFGDLLDLALGVGARVARVAS
jgi:hypothetical protein